MIRATRIAGLMAAMLIVAAAVTIGFRPGARPATAGTPVVEIHAAHGASFVAALQGKRPLFILALGSDARPGQRVDRQRADSIHLIGIDRSRTHATILGFPRDSWVHIPGFGTSKINSATG